MTSARFAISLALAACAAGPPLRAQTGRATVREYARTFPTYPFGDPNPVPVVGRIYPYFRFDGFSLHSEPRQWKVVELENDYLRVLILPEIGGKIWTAIDKRSGRPFIYFNQVVKFRDVAMRGPWTSGGIEANYGIIGHTPNVATPVEYLTRTNPDGSVSCIVGALDLLTRTPWRLDIRLAPQEAAFSTTSFWYNASAIEQPYYTWMNVGIPVKGNLQYVYPGTSYLGHNGEHGSWPITAEGRDISWYEHNDFGGYKSYHVFGKATDFFGAYWHDADFGMVRYAPRDEKAGKKIWIWGLSRQGMIWESLLTDADGQYSEVQSGRLFNQSAEQSTFTPFKHRGFAPHVVDRWTEYWYPVAGTGGFVTASRAGALNVTATANQLVLTFSPVMPIADTLRVFAGARLLHARPVARRALELFVDTLSIAGITRDSIRIELGDHVLSYALDPHAGELARPLDAPAAYDWETAVGRALRGKEWLRQREYDSAAVYLDAALDRDPFYLPALVDRAMLAYRGGDYVAAQRLAATALSVDTYDPGANYYYGLASRRLGRDADAKDGFELAAQSAEFRGAAWTELARLSLSDGHVTAAAAFADKALGVEPDNLDALGVALVAARRAGHRARIATLTARLAEADPLSLQARYEGLLASGNASAARTLAGTIRSELPEQSLFDLAAWYLDVGEREAGLRLLEAVGDQPEALYWRAQLLAPDDSSTARALVARANRLSPRLVFPFRPEMLPALEFATRASPDWQPRYYLALAWWSLGRVAGARPLLLGLGNQPDYAPFYATRAAFPGQAAAAVRADLERAAALDSSEWRYGRQLAEHWLTHGDTSAAITVAERYHVRFPANYLIGLTLAKAWLAGGRYADADQLLARLDVLPHEGAAEAHAMYREAKLQLAIVAARKRQWSAATTLITAARLWPERLGEGRPYDRDVDERLEDWLAADVLARSGQRTKARVLWERIAADTTSRRTASDVLPGWAARALTSSSATPTPPIAAPARGGADGRVLRAWFELNASLR